MEDKKVTIINPTAETSNNPQSKLRVAAYVRVSTNMAEQLNSLVNQKRYYINTIKNNKHWIFAGIYADEGISGTSVKSRDGFNNMIADALEGKINLILTKSISRFARNTVDALVNIRKLKEHNIAVYFERENINTIDENGEFLITLLSSLAQEEAYSLSENVKWAIRKNYQKGIYPFHTKNFLGYENINGVITINPDEAKTIRLIYYLFLIGNTTHQINTILTGMELGTPGGQKKWHTNTIDNIVKNEKYCGNTLLQKTFISDNFNKREIRNTGQFPKYFIEGDHPAIIDPMVWGKAQEEHERRLAANNNSGNVLLRKMVCSKCNNVFNKYSRTDLKRYMVFYCCYNKYSKSNKCSMPVIHEATLLYVFKKSILLSLEQHPEIISRLICLISKHLKNKSRTSKIQFCLKTYYYVVHDSVMQLVIDRAIISKGSVTIDLINHERYFFKCSYTYELPSLK